MTDKSSGNFTPKGGHPISGCYLTDPDDCSVGSVDEDAAQTVLTTESSSDVDELDIDAHRHPWDILR
jgi:hypothetical protein